jgi:hypothetical protein
VTAFNRRLFSAIAVLGLVGVAGCGGDNDADSKKLGTNAGDPGPANPDSKPAVQVAPPTSQADRARTEGAQQQGKKSGYTGGK